MRRLGTANVSGITYTICSAAPHERAKGAEPLTDDAYGATDHEQQCIVLSNALTPDRQAITLVHELLHAAIFESGAYEGLKRQVGPAVVRGVEECLVTSLAPALCGALISVGWTPPRFPKKAGTR